MRPVEQWGDMGGRPDNTQSSLKFLQCKIQKRILKSLEMFTLINSAVQLNYHNTAKRHDDPNLQISYGFV